MLSEYIDWKRAAVPPRLAPGEVHLWRISPEVDERRLNALKRCLSADERAKADRFRHAAHRRMSIVARAATRDVLGGYLRCPPAELEFRYNAYGKPELAAPADSSWSFNLSHSGDYALLAVADAAAVGVDIERHRPLENAPRMAERFFSQHERDVLRRLPPQEQPAAFFRCWTRKEAYIKAVGTGIFAGLDRFDVTLAPHDPPQVLRWHTAEYAPEEWSLADINVAPGYSGAVLVQRPRLALRYFGWQEKR